MRELIPFTAVGAVICWFVAGCAGETGAFIVDSEDNVIKIIAGGVW